MWRNRGRFLLFSLVIALITLLVLFIAALADGLGNGNREYIQKLNADLIVYKANVDLSIGASQLNRGKLAEVKRVDGVKDAGQVSFTSVVLLLDGDKKMNVAAIGVEPGKPGEPRVLQGTPLFLVFTCHFGCPQCNEMLDQLVKNKTELDKSGLAIAMVTQGNLIRTRSNFASVKHLGSSADQSNRARDGLYRRPRWSVAGPPQSEC